MSKIDARKLGSEAQEIIRKRSIEALKMGKKEREVCELFVVSRVAVYKRLCEKLVKARKMVHTVM